MGKVKICLFISLLIVLAFQGCSNNLSFQSAEELKIEKSENNGDGYTGKPTPYDFRMAQQACSEIGANGKPLPNAQIFLFPSGKAQLVRENCSDISPRFLTAQDFTFSSTGEILYQGRAYVLNSNQTPYDVVASQCPAGKTLLANPIRQSLLSEPINLESTAWAKPGLTVSFAGSLASLPLYQVERTDPNRLEAFRRLNQSLALRAAETYVMTFFARPDPSERILFTSFFPNNHDLRVEFDLMTGAPTVQSSSGIRTFSTQAQVFAGGLFISLYFQLQNDGSANLGIASLGEFLGSSISATAVQLEQVSNFCTP